LHIHLIADYTMKKYIHQFIQLLPSCTPTEQRQHKAGKLSTMAAENYCLRRKNIQSLNDSWVFENLFED